MYTTKTRDAFRIAAQATATFAAFLATIAALLIPVISAL